MKLKEMNMTGLRQQRTLLSVETLLVVLGSGAGHGNRNLAPELRKAIFPAGM